MANATVEQLLIRIDATTEVLRRELKRADMEMGTFERKTNRALKEIERSFTRFKSQISGVLVGAFSIYGITRYTEEVIKASDTLKSLRAQIGLVTDSQDELNSVYTKLFNIANKTGQALDSTVTIFTRMARNTEELGISQNELLRTTETLNKAFVVSGANSREASNAMIQLSQAYGKGRLDGEEFNAIAEQAPIILRSIAKQLNTNVGALKQYAEDGKITVDVLRAAFADLASTIDEDFASIPVTVGRAWQALSNTLTDALGRVDAQPLIDSIVELQQTINDPAFAQALTRISQGMIDLATALAKATVGFSNFGTEIGEFFAQLSSGVATDDVITLANKITKLREAISSNQDRNAVQDFGPFKWLNDKNLERMQANLAKLEAQWKVAAMFNVDLASSMGDTNDAADEMVNLSNVIIKSKKIENKELNKLISQYEKENAARKKQIESYIKTKESIEEYIDNLEWEYALLKLSDRDRERVIAQRNLDAEATERQRNAVDALTQAIYDEEQKLEDIKRAQEEAKNAQDQWNEALVRTRERIDEAFAGAWKGAFDSFKDFASSLKDAFENLLAELAHLAITRPIVMSITGALGLGGSSAAMAGGGAASGPMSILSNIAGIGTSAIGGLGQLAFLGARAGIPGMTTMASNAFMTANTIGAAGLFTAGLGTIGGGLLGSQLYGPTSGLGSAAGGLAGTAFLTPMLAALGPAAPFVAGLLGGVGGGFVESLFGGKNNGNNSGRATIDLATGQISAQGVGKTFDEANVQAAQQLAQQIGELAKIFGVTDRQYQVQVGNRFGVKLDGQKVGDAGDALAKVMSDLLEETDLLTDNLKELVKAFDGTTEQTAQFVMGIANIANLMGRNPVTEAATDFRNQLELAGMTTRQVYNEQISAIDRMVSAFDGSLESTQALSTAMTANKQLAYDLAMALQAVNQQIMGMVASQIQYFKQQTFTPDEMIKDLEKSFSFLWGGLSQQTDPEKIRQIGESLLYINQQLFDLGSKDLQGANVDFFIDRAKAIEEAVSGAVLTASVDLAATQEDMNTKVQNMLQQSASQFQASANTMESAAQIFAQAVQYFTGNATGQYAEVTA